MKSQLELEERLRAMSEWLEVGPASIDRIVRRARRRLAAKVLSSAVVAVVLAAALILTGTSLSGFRQELRLGDGTTLPKPRIVATIPISGPSWGVAFDGSKVWVASYFDDLILSVDPETNLEVDRISGSGQSPFELTVGDGRVWANGATSIVRIDPGASQAVGIGIETNGYLAGMAYGDGALWVSDFRRDVVRRVDPSTNRVVAEVPVRRPNEMAFGDGSVWVGGCQQQGQKGAPLYQIDPKSNRVIGMIELPAPGCAGLPAFGEGFLYAFSFPMGDAGYQKSPESDLPTELWKIDPSTNQVIAGPVSLAAPGAPVVHQGVVWVTSRERAGHDGRSLTLIDAITMRVLARMSVGQSAWRIAVGAGSLWIPALDEGRPVLFRIAP